MHQIFQMALKDIKLILRDRLGLFFIVGFPIMMGLFFGSMMNGIGGSGGSSQIPVAIIDEDQTEVSKSFVQSLLNNKQLLINEVSMEQGRSSVRKGNLVALIVLPGGFSEKAGVMWNGPPKIQIERDPSRQAETAMLEGFVMQAMGELIGKRLQDPAQLRSMLDESRRELAGNEMSIVQRGLMNGLLGSLDSMLESVDKLQADDSGAANDAMANNMQFADVETQDVVREVSQDNRVRSGWDISFPQAMLWGMLSCVAGFAISIARERTMGTFVRLQVAPVSRFEILAGKAMACFLTSLSVIAVLTILGMFLGMRPENFPMLILVAVCISFCFVGIMMIISVIGKTEQGVSGAGWGINMVMAMLGGCMIPYMFLPAEIKPFTIVSPVKWAIQALEGAIWRQYSWTEIMFPCAVLIGFGLVGLTIGGMIISRQRD